MRQLRVSWVLSDLTLGQIWEVDLQRNERIVRDVILIAQGRRWLWRSFWNRFDKPVIGPSPVVTIDTRAVVCL